MWHWAKTEKFVGITQVINLAVKTKPTCVAQTAQQKCKFKALFRNLLRTLSDYAILLKFKQV